MGEGGQGFRCKGRLIDSLPTHPRVAEWTSRDARKLPASVIAKDGRNLPTSVIPAKAGIHFATVKKPMDSRLRGNDDIKVREVREALAPPRPPCKPKPRGNERH